jgi:hypothetical protein
MPITRRTSQLCTQRKPPRRLLRQPRRPRTKLLTKSKRVQRKPRQTPRKLRKRRLKR